MRAAIVRGILVTFLVVDLLLGAVLWLGSPRRFPHRVSDAVGYITTADQYEYNAFLARMQRESGIDVHIALVPSTGGRPAEEFALDLMRRLRVGQETGGRGMLIVYDTSARTMRIEVGPKLEGILPDAFVGYLMREHVSAFFGAGRHELGLRTTLFMIHWRIRNARLGEEYDPAFEEYVREVRRLALGGGASSRIGSDGSTAKFINNVGDTVAAGYFRPQPSVEAAYRRSLEWLALGGGQVDAPLFTPASRTYLAQLPLSPAFNAYLLATEYGRHYVIDQRGDLAMLYYTDDPFLSPKFYRRTPDGWQVDIAAEVANSQETIGFHYTWRLRISGDDFSEVFADRYMPLPEATGVDYYRVAGGDNRALTIRGKAPAIESELDGHTASVVIPWADAIPGAEWVTVRQAAERIREIKGRPAVIVLVGIWNLQMSGQFSEIVRVARACQERGVEFLAFQKDASDEALTDYVGLVQRHHAPFPAVQLYPWRPGLLDRSMGELGITVGRTWSPPLVAVLDRGGQVTWQAQGVTDWPHVARAAGC